MNFGRTIWRQRAGLLVASGLFLLGNAAFLVGSRSITNNRRAALEARRAALLREVATREAEAAKLVRQQERLARVSSVIEEFYGRRVGTRRETLAPLVDEIHTVMRRVGVAPKTISYTTAEIRDLPLSQMLVSFGFQSDYPRFKRLLAAFEADRMWLIVREVGLARGEDAPGEVLVRLVLATYFSERGAGEIPPPPASTRMTVRSSRTTVRQ